MADGQFPSLVSKDRNANSITNPIFIELSDGTNSALVDVGNNLQVILASNTGVDIGDVDVISVIPGIASANLGKAEDAAHSTGDVGVMALAVRQDSDLSFSATSGDYVPLQIDATGALKVNVKSSVAAGGLIDDAAFTVGADTVVGQGFLADETAPDSVNEGDIGCARMTLDRKQIYVLADATIDSQRLAINVAGEAQVDLAAHSITNANALPISATNAANSELNPIFVQRVDTVNSGEEIHDYNTAAAVASDATSNHNYIVAGATFKLKSVIVSASGRTKAEIQVGPTLSLATKAVIFTDEDGFGQVNFDPAIEVPVTGTGTIRVIRTNREGAAMDIYSTILGLDI